MGNRIGIVVLASLLVAGAASAQMYRNGPPPQHRLVYRDLSVVRVNPLGLITDARLQYRYRLFESESPALRDNFVSFGVAPAASAAFARIGPIVEVQPLSILQLWASYEVIGYFGTFNLIQSFASSTARYSDAEISRLGRLPPGDPLRHYATSGTQLNLGASLQIKVSSVVLRSQLRAARPDMNLRQGDVVFYDQLFDLLVPNRGWFFTNDLDLLWQSDTGWTAGIRYTTSAALYGEEHRLEGEPADAQPGALHRAGPLVAYTWRQEDGARFEPTVLLVLNAWIASPYRTGQEVSRLVPYGALGFAITGDLL